jgi:hypothetical protein
MAQGWSAIEVFGEPGEHPDPLGWRATVSNVRSRSLALRRCS